MDWSIIVLIIVLAMMVNYRLSQYLEHRHEEEMHRIGCIRCEDCGCYCHEKEEQETAESKDHSF